MSGKEKKYLDDEQVKKNLDIFINDRENFLNDSSYLDNVDLSYKMNNDVKQKSDDSVLENDSVDNSKKQNEKKEEERSTYLWIPILLSFLMLIMIFIYIIYFYCKVGVVEELINPGGVEGRGVTFLFALVVFLPLVISVITNFSYVFLGVWLFYSLWFLIKLFIFKNGEKCELRSFLTCICIFILLIVLKIVGIF